MGAQPDTSTSAPDVWHGIQQILAQIPVAAHLATYLAAILLVRARQFVLDLDRDMVVLLPDPAFEQGDRAAPDGHDPARDRVEQKLMARLQDDDVRQTHGVRWAAPRSGGLKSLRPSDQRRRIQNRG